MEYIWVKPERDDEFELPYGACIVEKLVKHVKIQDDNGKTRNILHKEILRPMHTSCIKDVDDMIKLGDLQEYTILRNLELRFRKKLIYTYTGNVLIAVNPYQPIPIYGNDVIGQYRNKKLGELPPHLFAIGDVSYENMRFNGEKQCIIINGESGAGKTESAKHILQYYAAITGKHSKINEQILESNPVLEAFGNAKTVRNDNSSRFGKYISIYFNAEGRMVQAEIRQFLLEKSRIVTQCKGERNYHVFYMLLKGLSAEEKNLLGLKDVPFYKNLEEDSLKMDREEKADFRTFRKALKTLNFSDTITWQIFELLAVILHFENIEYHEGLISGVEAVEVLDSKELSVISTTIGVPIHYLKSCLTKKTIATGSDKASKMLNKQEATDTRDAFVKAIYANLFAFVVGKVNEAIGKAGVESRGYIGVLDVFGFENYKSNSFEQLCINLANENLQQFFIKHTFKLEQVQYIEEGISWTGVNFVDNRAIVDMISVKPMNIISIINDQSKFPNSTDEKLLEKLIEHHGENELFLTPKFCNILVFGIQHFAGVVLYDVKDFLEKNRDSCSYDFTNLARSSEHPLLRKIFAEDFAALQSHLPAKKRTQKTSATKFKESLDELMAELNECRPFFVRCVKPNHLKKPNLFDRILCCQQLRYSGIWETSKIRQIGFAVRYTYREFVVRYRLLKREVLPASSLNPEELQAATRDICTSVLKANLEKQFGYTKVFLRNSEYLTLEKEREKLLSRYVVILQSAFRSHLLRKRYLALKKSAIVVQRRWRGRRERKRYQIARRGFLRLEAVIHGRYQRIFYLKVHHVLLRFQARCKGFAVRRMFHQKLQKRANEKKNAIVAARPPDRPEEKVSGSSTSTWKKMFTKGKPTKQASYLHGRNETPRTTQQFAEVSKLVDDSFRFLNDHGSRNVVYTSYNRKI